MWFLSPGQEPSLAWGGGSWTRGQGEMGTQRVGGVHAESPPAWRKGSCEFNRTLPGRADIHQKRGRRLPRAVCRALHCSLRSAYAFRDELPRIVGAGPEKHGPGPGLSYRQVSSSGHSFFLKISVTSSAFWNFPQHIQSPETSPV